MPSAAAQDVLQAILERRAAQKRREMAALPAGPPAVLPFSNRIAGAFEAAEPVRQVDELSAPITLPFAARNQLGDWGPRMPNVLKTIADPRTSPFGPAAVARLFMDPAGEVGRQVETGEQLAEPFTQFNDPQVDPVKQGADLALTAMGGSAAVPAEVNSLQAGAKLFRSPYSKIGQNIPIEEMAPIYGRGGAKQLPRTPIDINAIREGDVLFPFVSDRSYTGRDLAGIRIGDEEVMFKNAVPSEGGAGFASRAVNPQDIWFASNRGVVTRQKNVLQALHDELAAEGKGAKIIGATVGMAPEGIDFSMQATRTARETLRRQPLKMDQRNDLYEAIDAAMKAPWGKNKFPAVPDWPGMKFIMGKGGDEYLQGIGTGRAKFVKLLDTDVMRKRGAPNMAAVRKAATDPKQVNDRSLTAGHSFFEFGQRPTAVAPEDVLHPNSSYPWNVQSTKGRFLGSSPMPAEEIFQDWGAEAAGLKDMAQKQKSITTKMPVQRVTPEVLATIQKWLKSPQGQKLGIAGAVAAGLITAEQAQMFGDAPAPAGT